jgi:hypothetical protein
MKRIVTYLLLTITGSFSWGGSYEWTSGWGMGVSEYQVDDGNGNALIISCPDYDDPISAFASIEGKEYWSNDLPGFDVIIDGKRYHNPFFTNCRVCSTTFRNVFWEALRTTHHLHLTAEGVTVTLPTKKLKSSIPAISDSDNTCRVAW